MKAIFDHSEPRASNIISFFFKPEQPLQYTAGQYTRLTLDHSQPDDRGIRRWFTLSASPTEPLPFITTKFADKDGSSFKKALLKLKPGTEADLASPIGDFVLPKLVQTPLIFVAGGIGITPFRSMFRWLADTKEERNIKFIYGVRTEDEIVFQEDMEAAGVHATIVVGEPSPAWGGERGKLTAELIIGLEKPTDDTLIYLSGPEPMLEALAEDLKKQGIKEEQIVTDFFPGYEKI
ncbi:MAG TPA: FAD-dependent oxidoreductase [Patescibacteria group bacterium]|nr:FAD-dependent oxidoreductase [Patescibacteria group bacterium]